MENVNKKQNNNGRRDTKQTEIIARKFNLPERKQEKRK